MLVRLADLGLNVPADDVYSDPDRAIRLLWNRHDRNVELVFPPTEGPYLYHSDEHEYQAEENPNPESVFNSIRRILGDVPQRYCARDWGHTKKKLSPCMSAISGKSLSMTTALMSDLIPLKVILITH